nr:AAA family ATPase [Acanthopleuribacter pedis]
MDLTCRLHWSEQFRKDDRGLQGIEYLEEPGCLLLGYGPYRRLNERSGDALSFAKSRFWADRLQTLFRNDAALTDAITWLREVDYRSLKGDRRGRFQKLKDQSIQILSDGLFPTGVSVLDVDAEGLKVRSGDQVTTLEQLSDGYKAVAALVVDILRHIVRSFGDLDFRMLKSEGKPYPVSYREGIVLIDEVETHLHLSWQREIGFWLKKHFPKIQFLVTTHSPFVCQAADSRGIIRLPDPDSGAPVAHLAADQFDIVVNGNTADAATSDLFGLPFAHADHAEALRTRFAELEAALLYEDLSPEARREKREAFNRLQARLPLGLQER